MPKRTYVDARARRLAGNAKPMTLIAAIFAVFETAGLVGSGGTVTAIHLIIGAIMAVFALVAAGSIAAARWLDRYVPVVPEYRIRIEPEAPAAVAVAPEPVIDPVPAWSDLPVVEDEAIVEPVSASVCDEAAPVVEPEPVPVS